MTLLPSPVPHPLDFSPWDLPGWCYEALEWVVGFDWPAGDEAATWDVADRWFTLAGLLAEPSEDAAAAASKILSGYAGDGADAFAAAFNQVPLDALIEVANELGKMIEECGCDIEGAKIEAWIEIGLFVIELVAMAVAVTLTLGAASPAAGGLIAATRFVIQQIFKKLVEQLSRKALKQAGSRAVAQLSTRAGWKTLGRGALREGFDEAREELATNLAIQTYQNAGGRADGISAAELGRSAAGGFGGGFASGGAHVGAGHHGSGGLGRGAAGEVLGEFGGAAVTGDLPSAEGLAKSATSGVAGSAMTAGGSADLSALAPASLPGLPPGAPPTSAPPPGGTLADPVAFAGDPAGLDGDPAPLSGKPTTLSGAPAALAGDPGGTGSESPAALSGDPAALVSEPAAFIGDLGGAGSEGSAGLVGDPRGTGSESPAALSGNPAALASDPTALIGDPGGTGSESPAALVGDPRGTGPEGPGPLAAEATAGSGSAVFGGDAAGPGALSDPLAPTTPLPVAVDPATALASDTATALASDTATTLASDTATGLGSDAVAGLGVESVAGGPGDFAVETSRPISDGATTHVAADSAAAMAADLGGGAGALTSGGGAADLGISDTVGAGTSSAGGAASVADLPGDAAAVDMRGPSAAGVAPTITTDPTPGLSAASVASPAVLPGAGLPDPTGSSPAGQFPTSSAVPPSVGSDVDLGGPQSSPDQRNRPSVDQRPGAADQPHRADGRATVPTTSRVDPASLIPTSDAPRGGSRPQADGPSRTGPASPANVGINTTPRPGSAPTDADPRVHTPPASIDADPARAGVTPPATPQTGRATVEPVPPVGGAGSPDSTTRPGTRPADTGAPRVETTPPDGPAAGVVVTGPRPGPLPGDGSAPRAGVASPDVAAPRTGPPPADSGSPRTHLPLGPRRDPDQAEDRSDLAIIAAALGPPAAVRKDPDALEAEAYFGYQRHARTSFENQRREDTASGLRSRSIGLHLNATKMNRDADVALRDGLTLRAENLRASARDSVLESQELQTRAARVAVGELPPAVVEVSGANWTRINDDVGNLVPGGIDTDDTSRLTGDDHPAAVNRSRRYDVPGGLRRPLAVHQKDLERAMPRDGDGRVVRQADPREGNWFGLANDGGPEADPTRGINCVDGVLSLFDTYLHGRPRVSAPRTFDSYAWGDPNRPLGPEKDGIARIQHLTQGHFASLTPPGSDPRQSVDQGMHRLTSHLLSLEHGAFAFIVTQSTGGDAHAWAAVNHHGTVLFLDPQTRQISEDIPLYRNTGHPSPSNVVSVAALVTDPDGNYSSPPFHESNRPGNPPDPTGTDPNPEEPDSKRVEVAETKAQKEERLALESMKSEDRAFLNSEITRYRGVADAVLADLRSVTAALNVANSDDGPRLVGEEKRVKTPGSIARTFVPQSDIDEDYRLADHLLGLKDRVRFMVQTPESSYGESVSAILTALESRSYTVKKRLSFWGSGGRHNGLNVTVIDPRSRMPVEIQFPTPLSRVVAEINHPSYQEFRQPSLQESVRVEAFLKILATNKDKMMDHHQPLDLDNVGSFTTRDTSFTAWLRDEPDLLLRCVEQLERAGTTFDELLAKYRLERVDVFGTGDDSV